MNKKVNVKVKVNQKKKKEKEKKKHLDLFLFEGPRLSSLTLTSLSHIYKVFLTISNNNKVFFNKKK